MRRRERCLVGIFVITAALAAWLVWLRSRDTQPELRPPPTFVASRAPVVAPTAARHPASAPEQPPASPTPPAPAPAADPLPPAPVAQEAKSAPAAAEEIAADEAENRRRYTVRWGTAGLCGNESAEKMAIRATTLATFHRIDTDLDVMADPSLPADAVGVVVAWVREGLRLVAPWYTPPAPPPPIVIYKDLEQLRAGACVNASAVAYFDGTLQVTPDPRLGPYQVRESVVHEIVHHALLARGVREPMWLQEGLAMNVAQERWWRDPALGVLAWAQDSHLPFDAMVRAFPHTADESFALAAYFQSMAMVEAVLRAGDVKGLQNLIEALAQRQVTPSEAFSWALGGADAEKQEVSWREAMQSLATLED